MKRLFTLILAAVLVSNMALSLQSCAPVQSNEGREFRGGWIHIVGNTKIKDMSRQEVQDMFVEVLGMILKLKLQYFGHLMQS